MGLDGTVLGVGLRQALLSMVRGERARVRTTAALARSPLRAAPMSMSAKNALETLASTRVLVSGTAFGVLVWRRDAASVLCITGAVINAIFSKILKRLINESRPAGAQESDPGMPSSHAMSLFFFATYLVLLAATTPSALMPPPVPAGVKPPRSRPLPTQQQRPTRPKTAMKTICPPGPTTARWIRSS